MLNGWQTIRLAVILQKAGSTMKILKNTTLIVPNILGIISGHGVLIQLIWSNIKNDAMVFIQFGNVKVAISTPNTKFLLLNSNFANAYAARVEEKIPTIIPGR